MGIHDSATKGYPEKGTDYNELANAVEEFREVINALVAGLITDGFTDREARALVAGFWASRIKDNKIGDE
jgi:hypothetical protein